MELECILSLGSMLTTLLYEEAFKYTEKPRNNSSHMSFASHLQPGWKKAAKHQRLKASCGGVPDLSGKDNICHCPSRKISLQEQGWHLQLVRED